MRWFLESFWQLVNRSKRLSFKGLLLLRSFLFSIDCLFDYLWIVFINLILPLQRLLNFIHFFRSSRIRVTSSRLRGSTAGNRKIWTMTSWIFFLPIISFEMVLHTLKLSFEWCLYINMFILIMIIICHKLAFVVFLSNKMGVSASATIELCNSYYNYLVF